MGAGLASIGGTTCAVGDAKTGADIAVGPAIVAGDALNIPAPAAALDWIEVGIPDARPDWKPPARLLGANAEPPAEPIPAPGETGPDGTDGIDGADADGIDGADGAEGTDGVAAAGTED